jgi:hypothetical protein
LGLGLETYSLGTQVEMVNEGIRIPGRHKSIGLLDIYGFEVLQENGFEQVRVLIISTSRNSFVRAGLTVSGLAGSCASTL